MLRQGVAQAAEGLSGVVATVLVAAPEKAAEGAPEVTVEGAPEGAEEAEEAATSEAEELGTACDALDELQAANEPSTAQAASGERRLTAPP